MISKEKETNHVKHTLLDIAYVTQRNELPNATHGMDHPQGQALALLHIMYQSNRQMVNKMQQSDIGGVYWTTL